MGNSVEDDEQLAEESTDGRDDVILLSVVPSVDFDDVCTRGFGN